MENRFSRSAPLGFENPRNNIERDYENDYSCVYITIAIDVSRAPQVWTLSIIYGGVIRSGWFAVGDDSSRNASQPDKSTFNMPFESELYTTLPGEIAVGLTCLHLSEPERVLDAYVNQQYGAGKILPCYCRREDHPTELLALISLPPPSISPTLPISFL